MSRIMSAIEGISDRHIETFAFMQIPKRKIPLWVKIGSAVASLVLIMLTVTITEYLTRGRVEVGGWNPYVIFNDEYYIMSPTTDRVVPELPDGYVLVGAVSTIDYNKEYSNGSSSCCAVGDEIYQNPTNLQNLYVRTKFLGNGEFRFIRFEIQKKKPYVVFNDSSYFVVSEDYQQSTLPNEYVFVGTINSNALKDCLSNGYSWCCSIGDEIYQNLDDPDDLYVKTKFFSNSNEYRFIRFEKWL